MDKKLTALVVVGRSPSDMNSYSDLGIVHCKTIRFPSYFPSELSAGNMTLVESVSGVTPESAAGLAIKQAYVLGFRERLHLWSST